MNAAAQILHELRERGIRVEPRPDGRLRLAPARLLTPELTERARQHKAEILAALTAPGPKSEVDRIAALDGERNEADRQARRGYDYDESAPSHPEYVARQDAEYETARVIAAECETAGEDLARRLEKHGFRLLDDLEEGQ